MRDQKLFTFLLPRVVFEWPKGILHYYTSFKVTFCFNLRARIFLLKWPKIISQKNYLIICFFGGGHQKILFFPRKCQKGGSKKPYFGPKIISQKNYLIICFFPPLCLLANFNSAIEFLPLFLKNPENPDFCSRPIPPKSGKFVLKNASLLPDQF